MSSTSIIRLTPPGRSAVASIRVEGENIAKILKHLRRENASRSTPIFARFPLEGLGTREEVVLHILDENRLEIHSHGGEAVVAAITQTLRKQFGAMEIPWNDWIAESQAVGKSEQVKKAIALIPYAKTERVAQILVDQYHGALEREMAAMQNCDAAEKERRNARLVENAKLGRRILTPHKIVLFGPVNSGKSSLLNAIVGFQRVIVHADAGTTRDAVGVESVIDGWPVTIVDTAGIRTTDHEIEQEGIRLAWESVQTADLVLKIVDLTQKKNEPIIPLEHSNVLTIVNKCDLPEVQKSAATLFPAALKISAKTGEGLENLLDQISKRLVPNPPQSGEAIPL